jgi:hypothetical protein
MEATHQILSAEHDLHEFREVAGYWHDGQGSAAYAFTSSGTILPGLTAEIAESGRIATDEAPEDSGALLCLLVLLHEVAEPYFAYAQACEEENLDAHDYHMWEVHGRPAGPLG